MAVLRWIWLLVLLGFSVGEAQSEPREQPAAVSAEVLLDEARSTTKDLFGFPVVEFYPVGFSRKSAFAYVVSAQRYIDVEDNFESGWSLEVMDLKTDTVIARLWISKFEMLKTASQRSKAVEFLQEHGIDGRPVARLAESGDQQGFSPFSASVSAIETRLTSESTPLRPFPLYLDKTASTGTGAFYSAVLLEEDGETLTQTISLKRSRSSSKAIGQTMGFSSFNAVLGAVISPWESRIVVVVLEVGHGFECGGMYGGLMLAGAHLETGSWTTKPAAFVRKEGQDPVWLFPFGCP